MTERKAAANSTCKKLAVQWLNEALCFVSSLVLADSFRLRNRQLLVAAKRYGAKPQISLEGGSNLSYTLKTDILNSMGLKNMLLQVYSPSRGGIRGRNQ